jgi:dinuclear metal center YbgI/SA1388 family protein
MISWGVTFLKQARLIANIMLLSQLIQKLKEIAPPENGFKDDIYGLQYGNEINDCSLHTVVVCLDPTKAVIKEAIKLKARMIISHHGLTHQKILYFKDLLVDRLSLLSTNQIALFVMHTAWDAAPEGISETFAKVAGLTIEGNYYFEDGGKRKPIGRIGRPFRDGMTIQQIGENLKRHLCLERVRILGDFNHIVKKAAVVGGKGLKPEEIPDIIQAGCDTFITGEVNLPEMIAARELGLNIIETSHYKSEKIGMESLQRILTTKFPRNEFIFLESEEPMKIL